MRPIKLLAIIALGIILNVPVFGQLKVQADGRVGIGATTISSPLKLLVEGGNTRLKGGLLQIGADAGTSESSVQVGFQRTGSGAASIRFYNGPGGFASSATVFGVDAAGGGGLFHNGAAALYVVTQNTSSVRFGVQNLDKLAINGTDGFVGINTITPSHQLSVNGEAFKTAGSSAWVIPSDKRLKKEIRPFQDGLRQVLAINPVVYKYNGKGGTNDDGKEYIGVITQEIQKVAPYTVGTFTYKEVERTMVEDAFAPIERIVKEETYYSYDATALTYMLINAIKEQQSMIEERDARITVLEERLARLERIVLKGSSFNQQTIELENNASSFLMQNQPNPFNQTTTIQYTLPQESSNAAIRIIDMNGRLIKQVPLQPGLKGEILINAGELTPGTYSYSLLIDGQIVDTKKMILTK